jgi:hypothetical protein
MHSRARAACWLLGAALAAPADVWSAQSKLIEFGAGVTPPALPLPLPEWAAPAPSGITVESGELPPTPVPPVLTLPEIVPIPEVAGPASPGESRDDARVPTHAGDELPHAVEPAPEAALEPALAPRTLTVNLLPTVKAMRFVVRGNRSLPADAIKAVLMPYVAGTGGDVQSACVALQQAYAHAGRPFVRVRAAPGTDNVVLFEIAEPKLRSMQVAPGLGDAPRALTADDEGETGSPGLRMTRGLRLIRSNAAD